MKRTLSSSVMLVLVTINVVVFGAAGAWLTRTLALRSEREEQRVLRILEERIQDSIISRGQVRAGGILSWEGWDGFADALVVAAPILDAPERLEPRGVVLNPVGASHRGPDFQPQSVLADIWEAVGTREVVRTPRGVSLPVLDPDGEIWGGCWIVPRGTWSLGRLLGILLPWFGVSTVLLIAGTYFALHRLVLRPVRQLAQGTSRLTRGDLAARLPEPVGDDELSRLVRDFNSMALELQSFGERLAHEVEVATAKARTAQAAAMNQRRLAATGELAAGIAHEINNPLGGILNAVEALQREDLPAARRAEYLDLVRGALERIRHTVGGVLRLAPRRTAIGPVDLARPIADALELVRHRAESEGVAIRVARGDGPLELASGQEAAHALAGLPPVLGDAGEIGQAVLNLLVNALDAFQDERAPPRGERRIELRLGHQAGALHLTLADNGPGLDPGLLERASDPFFSTKEPGKGTGLGLAIVNGMVGGLGGRLELSSEPGQGFRVEVVLPAGERGNGGEGR